MQAPETAEAGQCEGEEPVFRTHLLAAGNELSSRLSGGYIAVHGGDSGAGVKLARSSHETSSRGKSSVNNQKSIPADDVPDRQWVRKRGAAADELQ